MTDGRRLRLLFDEHRPLPARDVYEVVAEGPAMTDGRQLPSRQLLFDEQCRLRKQVKRAVVAELHCHRRAHHLLALVFRTPRGPFAAYRQPWVVEYINRRRGEGEAVEHTRGWWEIDWVDNAGAQFVSCACPKRWLVDLTWLATQSGTVLTNEMPRRHLEAGDDLCDEAPDPFE